MKQFQRNDPLQIDLLDLVSDMSTEEKKQRRGGSWSSREINFTYYFYCMKPRKVLTFRQAVLFLDIISRTELLEGETVVNTLKQ